MPIRFRVSLRGNGRSAAIGALAILALLVTSCNPIQGDIPQLLTPVAPPEAEETAAPAPPEMVTLEATVAVNALRVRQEADAESPIIAGMLQGDVIPVIGRTEDGSWLKVRVPDVETIGWIWAEDVTLEGDAAALLVSEDGGEMAEEAAAESDDGEMAAETAAEGESDDDETAMEALEPSVTVHAQDVIKGTITIAEAVAQEKGWISVHADDAGSLGPIIGQATLEAGVTTGLTVRVDVDAATETLYAMLHIDGGVFDIFEFPGPDLPVLEEGEPISPAFRVTIGEMSMAEDDADEELRPEPTSTDPTPTELALLSQGDVTTQVAIIQSRALRVRSTPETISEVLAGVTAGEAYPVAGFSADQEWVAIFFYDIEDPVWVSASLVELRELEFRVQMGRATVDLGVYGRLRLRGGPSLEAPVVGHVQSGESYSILGFSADGGWALLVGTEVKGPVWASASFLRLE
jgi:uncharacterized protein YgiM (DUF1202 family)